MVWLPMSPMIGRGAQDGVEAGVIEAFPPILVDLGFGKFLEALVPGHFRPRDKLHSLGFSRYSKAIQASFSFNPLRWEHWKLLRGF